MGLAGLMFSVLDKPVYLVYSVKSHNNTGTWMLIMCIVLLVIVLLFYLIKRALFTLAPDKFPLPRIISYAISLELSFILPKLMCEGKHKAMLGQSGMV